MLPTSLSTTDHHASSLVFVEQTEGVDPQLLTLFNQLEGFPLWLQEGLAPLLLQGLERVNQDTYVYQGNKAAGADRLKVYLSMQQFWPNIPKQSQLAKVIKVALLMNEQGQTVFCYRFGELVGLVNVYLQACETKNQSPQPRHISVILTTAIELGIVEAKRVMDQELLGIA